MMDEKSFRRLLRWYPRRWRRENGAVMLGTMLDRADHEGRTAPTVAERASAALHGSATHLTARLALVSATIAASLGALGGAVMLWSPAALSPHLDSVLNAAVIPLLLAVALVSVVRVRGWASDGTAIAFIAVGGASLVLGSLARIGWSQAFDAADAGREAGGLGAAVSVFALAGIVTGTIAIALVVGSALRRAMPARPPRLLVASALGMVGAISVAWVLIVPSAAAVLSVGAVWVATTLTSPSAETVRTHAATDTSLVATTAARAPEPTRPTLRPGTRRLALALSASSLAIGVLGIVAMAADLQWLPAGVAIHSDRVAQGIMILLLSALPLLAALGIRQAADTRTRARHVWAPLVLATLSIVGAVIAYRFAPGFSAMTPWLQASAVVGALAIAWWLTLRRGAALGISAGLVWAAPLGVFLAPALAFAVPISAVIALVRQSRVRRAKALPFPT